MDAVIGKMKILVVDDDVEIRSIVRVLLESEGYAVAECSSGEEALRSFAADIDLVILDVMMEGISGYQVCLKLREVWNGPILFLTAKSQNSDLVLGYSSRGDDFLSKPFIYSELVARVKGLLRRCLVYKGKVDEADPDRYIERKGLKVFLSRNEVWRDNDELNLTDTEYRVLRLLVQYPGKVFSTQNLYESVWEEPYFASSSNTVMAFIRKLREKIEADPQEPRLLKTIWGKGYRIE